MEFLEKRLAPAGIVSVVVTGGVLKITGDAEANLVSVREMFPEVYEIEGAAGTLISLNGADAVTGLTVEGVSKGLTIDLKDGADDLALHDLTLDDNVTVQMGNGENTVTLGGMDLGGALSISAGTGNDTLVDNGANIRVAGPINIALGDGGNAVTLDELSSLIFGGAVTYTGGKGDDSVHIGATMLTFGAGLTIKTGAGENVAEVVGLSLRMAGAVNYQSAGTDSTFRLEADEARISGGVTVNHTSGISSTTLKGADQLNIGGTVAISTGGNTCAATVNVEAQKVTVGGNLSISNGGGAHQVTVRGVAATVVDGSISISNGNTLPNQAGTTVSLVGERLEVGGGLTISNKQGDFETVIDNLFVDIGGKLSVSNAGTGTQAPEAENVVQIGGQVLHAGSLSVTNGAGCFNTLVDFTDAMIGGRVVISNGDSKVDALTNTAIGGSNWQVGGGVSITNGKGSFSTQISTSDEAGTSFRASGVVAITHGDTRMLSFITIQGNDFSARGLTIKSGNTLTESILNVTADLNSLHIGGALSITTGNASEFANINHQIEAGDDMTLGSLTIKSGSGIVNTHVGSNLMTVHGAVTIASPNVTLMGTERLHIGGATTITTNGSYLEARLISGDMHLGGRVSLNAGSGFLSAWIGETAGYIFSAGGFVLKSNGGSHVRIGGEDMQDLNVIGGISIATGAGSDDVAILGDGRITGGVNINLGKSEIARLTVSGSDGHDGLLHLGSGVVYTADVSAPRNLILHNASISGLSLTGGQQGDTVKLSDVRVRGAFNADLGGGNDQVDLNDVFITGATTLKTGAGNDQIRIEILTNHASTSEFKGGVNINLGADHDVLRIGEAANPALSATFHRAVTLDAGLPAGGNTLQLGLNLLFNSTLTTLNFPSP